MFDMLEDAWRKRDPYAIEASAASVGIRTSGSFHRNPTLLSEREQRELLGLLPYVPGTQLPPLPAPPPTHDVGWLRDALRPSDFYGLGIDVTTGRFSLARLREHCALFPAALPNAIFFRIHAVPHTLFCQRVHCTRQVTQNGGWCPRCLMGPFCGTCAPDTRPCRVCISLAVVAKQPWRMLYNRGAAVNKALAGSPHKESKEAFEAFAQTAPSMLAVRAVLARARRAPD